MVSASVIHVVVTCQPQIGHRRGKVCGYRQTS